MAFMFADIEEAIHLIKYEIKQEIVRGQAGTFFKAFIG